MISEIVEFKRYPGLLPQVAEIYTGCLSMIAGSLKAEPDLGIVDTPRGKIHSMASDFERMLGHWSKREVLEGYMMGRLLGGAAAVALSTDGKAEGYALVDMRKTRGKKTERPYLADLFVRPSSHGRGIGRQLLDIAELVSAGAMIEERDSCPASHQMLYTDAIAFRPSLGFYRNHGYEFTGDYGSAFPTVSVAKSIGSEIHFTYTSLMDGLSHILASRTV